MPIVLFLVAMSAFAQTPEAEIRAVRTQSNEAMRKHDSKAFGASLDIDFVMIRGNGVFVPSRQAYIEVLAKDFADPKAVRFERIADRVEISGAAPLAAEHGHWIGTRPDGSRAFSGTYLAMWRKTVGGWKIRSEMFVVLECADEEACAVYRK